MPLKTVPCKHGTFTVYDNDCYIGGALIATGEYSEPEVQKLLSLVDSDSVVIEVGANMGSISVPWAKKAALLVCFEQQSASCKVLAQNLEPNVPDGHAAYNQLAVGAKAGRAAMQPIDLDVPGINIGGVSVLKYSNGDAVEVTTLDAHCTGFHRVD